MEMSVAAGGRRFSAPKGLGGRMTKWRGVVASCAPHIGATVFVAMMLPASAEAACIKTSNGNFTCNTSETTQQKLTSSKVPLNVNVGPGVTFNVAPTNQSAFILSSNRQLTFTQAAGGGTIYGGNSGIRATSSGTGGISITTTGTTTGLKSAGIFAVNSNVAGTGITINAADVSGFVHGVNANNSGTGAINVTVSGTATANRIPKNATTNSTAISVNQTGGTDINIVANNVWGGTLGILANNQSLGKGGNTNVTVTGTIFGGTGTPVVDSGAISAVHLNSGALNINLAGSASSTKGYGILAVTGSGSSSATITANNITAALDGMKLTHAGTGALNVTVAGTVAGGTGAGINNTAASKGGTFTIGSTGTLRANSGNAFVDNANGASGSADSTLDVSGTLGGHARMGAGADRITLRAGATLASGAVLDGDNGAGSHIVGQIDVLNFSDWAGNINGGQIANQEQVLLSGAADVTFGGSGLSNANLTDGLAVQTGSGAVARFSSNFALNGSLLNFGAVDLSSRHLGAGAVLSVAGNYTGGGQFRIDVDFATDTSDQLMVSGNVTGTTYVVVNDMSSGAATGHNVAFVTVGGTTSAGDFQLANGPISVGAYNYDAQLVGQQWVLGVVTQPAAFARTAAFSPTALAAPLAFAPAAAALPALNATAALYESAPDILLGAFAELPTYRQRTSQRQWLSQPAEGGEGFQGFWLRTSGEWYDVNSRQSLSGASYDWNSTTLQAGADFNLGDWTLGLTAKYGHLNADVTNPLGFGSLDGDGYGIGANATWVGGNGSYLDMQAEANWISADFGTNTAGTLTNGTDMHTYALSIEAGHAFAIGENQSLTPQAQLSWGTLGGSRFTDLQASAVDLGDPDRLVGRIGVAYDFGTGNASGGNRFYAVGNILHDFSGTRTVDLAGTTLSSKNGGTWAEIGLGGAVELGGGASLYAEGAYRSALSSGSSSAYSLSIGFRKTF